MKQRTLCLAIAVVVAAASLAAQNGITSGGHPDLSGTWLFSIDLPPIALKRQTSGSSTVKGIDASGSKTATTSNVPGARPSQPAPV
jgi:hypothetical protein